MSDLHSYRSNKEQARPQDSEKGDFHFGIPDQTYALPQFFPGFPFLYP